MLLLSGIWSLLLIVEFTRGLSPWLQTLSDLIWAAFVGQFIVEFAAAPSKRIYLRRRWLTALSLGLPALRLVRLVRIARLGRLARAARGIRLARLLSTFNRSMRALTLGFDLFDPNAAIDRVERASEHRSTTEDQRRVRDCARDLQPASR